MRICITGYRPKKLPARYGYNSHSAAYNELGKAIYDILLIEQLRHPGEALTCISGMALGVDQLYVRVAEHLKDSAYMKETSVKIIAAVPCRGQESKWPISGREEYHRILARCDIVHYITNGSFTPSCMEERNHWMVDNSDAVIAVWNGQPGGTANCIRYAKQQHKMIYYVDPETLQIRREYND